MEAKYRKLVLAVAGLLLTTANVFAQQQQRQPQALPKYLEPFRGQVISAPNTETRIMWRQRDLMKAEGLRIDTRDPSTLVRAYQLREQARREILGNNYTPPPMADRVAAGILTGIAGINTIPANDARAARQENRNLGQPLQKVWQRVNPFRKR